MTSRDETVGPLERGLAVLRLMAYDPAPAQRPGDLVRATGLARSTVDRVTGTLAHLGYLRTDGRDVALTPQVAEFGNAYLSASGIADAVRPHVLALAERLDESVSVAVPDADAVRFVTQATHRRRMAVAFRAGDALPAERCAPGALFAADWDAADRTRWRARLEADPAYEGFPALPSTGGDVFAGTAPTSPLATFDTRIDAARATGWALDDQLIEPGLIALAVPVRGARGAIVCAVSVVSHTSRHTAASLAEAALPAARGTAAAMEQALQAASLPRAAAPRTPSARPALKAELGAEFLQSLARGLDVLRALGTSPGPMPLADAARAAELPRATARRALLTLNALGYVGAYDSGYVLLPRVLELGYARMSVLTPADIAQPHLADLAQRVGETTSLAVLDGGDIRYVARVATRRIMSVDITIGTRFPAYATAMGRVLLAARPAEERAEYLRRVHPEPLTPHTVVDPVRLEALIDEAAHEGCAMVDGELEEGLRSLAVPVRDARGVVMAAVNVALHVARAPGDEVRSRLLPELRAAAGRIEADVAAVGRHA